MWPKPAHFIVLFFGRTGSTVLIEELRRQRRIRAECEILAECKRQGPEAQLERARQCYARALRPLRAAGFKTKLWDVLDPDGLASVLREVKARGIHMRRANVDLRNILTNYDDVAASLRGTPYEPMLAARTGAS